MNFVAAMETSFTGTETSVQTILPLTELSLLIAIMVTKGVVAHLCCTRVGSFKRTLSLC